MSNKAEPTVRWGVKRDAGDAGTKRIWVLTPGGGTAPFRSTSRREALRTAGEWNDSLNPRLVKLTRKPKPKVVRVKTMTWRDDGVRPVGTGSGPGVYWIGNFIQDHDDVSFKDKAMYRITIEELES